MPAPTPLPEPTPAVGPPGPPGPPGDPVRLNSMRVYVVTAAQFFREYVKDVQEL